MAAVAVLLADGFEEIEAITIIDILRRAGINVTTAGLHGGEVEASHGVRVIPDTTIDNIDPDLFDMIVLPGGQPGSDNLNADPRVKALLKQFSTQEKMVGAICAAPYVLCNAGLIEGKRVTAYPTYYNKLGGGVYEEKPVVIDGKLVTSRGVATAHLFALAIVEQLVDKDMVAKLRKAMLFD